jgi:hypothetical protein
MERAAHIACESQICCQVLLSHDNADIALIQLKPHAYPSGYITPEEFTARQLRSVGVVGLSGLKPLCFFKELLPPHVVDAIATAFLEYIRVLTGAEFAAQMEAAGIAELTRFCSLPDTRMN